MTEGMPNLSGTACWRCQSKQLVTFDVVETGRANSSRASVRVCAVCQAAWRVADEGLNPDLCGMGVGAVLGTLRVVKEMNQGLPFRVNKMYLTPFVPPEHPPKPMPEPLTWTLVGSSDTSCEGAPEDRWLVLKATSPLKEGT